MLLFVGNGFGAGWFCRGRGSYSIPGGSIRIECDSTLAFVRLPSGAILALQQGKDAAWDYDLYLNDYDLGFHANTDRKAGTKSSRLEKYRGPYEDGVAMTGMRTVTFVDADFDGVPDFRFSDFDDIVPKRATISTSFKSQAGEPDDPKDPE